MNLEDVAQGTNLTTPAPPAVAAGAGAAAQGIAGSFEQMAALVGQFVEAANADACIGAVQTVNGHTVIPVASVSLQTGFGMGFGGGEGGEGSAQGQGSGGGGGGGGRVSSRVMAIVDVSEAGVTVRPVPDVTTIVVGALAVLGLALLTARGGGNGNGRRLFAFLKPNEP